MSKLSLVVGSVLCLLLALIIDAHGTVPRSIDKYLFFDEVTGVVVQKDAIAVSVAFLDSDGVRQLLRRRRAGEKFSKLSVGQKVAVLVPPTVLPGNDTEAVLRNDLGDGLILSLTLLIASPILMVTAFLKKS